MKKYLPLILCGLSMISCNPLPNEMRLVKKGDTVAPRYFFNLEGIAGANELLVNFPNTIPGAKSIDKYLTPDAEYCLVHIRQLHLAKNNSIKGLEEVKKVQDNIYNILSYLVENCNVNKIYDEGLTPDFAPVKNFCAGVNARKIERLKDEAPALYNNYLFFESQKDYDAVYKLASETNKFTIEGAEDPDLLKEAEYTYNRLKGLGVFRWITEREKSFNAIHENRENHLLNIVSKQNSPLAIIVYGADHAWGGKISCGEKYERKRSDFCDNVAKWNSENSDKKFSLIEISPFGL